MRTRKATTSGTVQGFARGGVERWRAIPYARPPLGSLRFRAPEPPLPWRGVRYCQDFAYCAPQDPRYTYLGRAGRQPMSEDCLTLNVVAPEDAGDGPLPVMFFIHGGGYVLGSSATPVYDGAAIAKRGAVYVSANYRLGALGCLDLSTLSTPEHPLESNLFLRDLVLALGWVRDNIAEFGGDPGNVTIFGESAGAHAVATLLAVPAADGLFHRAISESPPGGLIHSCDYSAEIARRFVAGLAPGSAVAPGDAARVVMSARPSQLVRTLEAVMAATIKDTPDSFAVGATFGGEFLPRTHVEAMARGEAHRVPLIVGSNATEATLFARFMNDLPTNAAVIERYLANAEPEVAQGLRAAYPGYPGKVACLTFGGDFTFGSRAWELAEAHSAHAPTYHYRYDYAPRPLQWSGFGATHGTELLAVFDVYQTRVGGLLTAAGDRGSARRVSRDLQRRWRSFSRTGVPGDDWRLYSGTDRATMVFDRTSRVEFDPAAERRSAWAALRAAPRA